MKACKFLRFFFYVLSLLTRAQTPASLSTGNFFNMPPALERPSAFARASYACTPRKLSFETMSDASAESELEGLCGSFAACVAGSAGASAAASAAASAGASPAPHVKSRASHAELLKAPSRPRRTAATWMLGDSDGEEEVASLFRGALFPVCASPVQVFGRDLVAPHAPLAVRVQARYAHAAGTHAEGGFTGNAVCKNLTF
jgi:hypothetical protein